MCAANSRTVVRGAAPRTEYVFQTGLLYAAGEALGVAVQVRQSAGYLKSLREAVHFYNPVTGSQVQRRRSPRKGIPSGARRNIRKP